MDWVKDLPVDVLSKIASYKIGDPKYLKIKYNHIETLKRIQNKYKIITTEPEFTTYKLRTNNNRKCVRREYLVIRDVPFKIESLERIIRKQERELLSLIYEEVEDEQNFSAQLIVKADVVVKDPNKEYEDEEFEYQKALVCFDEINEDNSFPALQDIVEELMDEIKDDREQYNVIGIQAFHFRLRITE